MSMSEERVRAALESYVEPYLQQTLSQAGAVRAVEVRGELVLVKLELGFPAMGYAHVLQSALQRHLAALDLVIEVTL
ncbi:MAG: iron-sulfur cluster assembly protein, partial [Steroidobacteraceae bacterium]